MKKFFIFLSLFICISVHSQQAAAIANFETWYCPSWPCPTSGQPILSTGTLNGNLNYDWGGGNVLNSGRSDYVVVHVTASFVMPGTAGQSYTVYFLNQDDDGSILKIGGTTVIDDWSGLHAPSNRGGSINLIGGQTYTYERFFSEWGGGAVMRQLWQIYGIHGSYVWMNADSNLFLPAVGPTVVGGIITQSNAPAGQTLSSGGGASAGPSIQETTRISNWASRSTGQVANNYLYVEQISGEYNNVTVTQSGTYNTANLGMAGAGSNTVNITQNGSAYLNGLVQGANNTFTSTQTNNYQETKIVGNSNNVITNQTGNANQLMFNTVTGNNNTVNATQTGNAQHYLSTTLLGDGNSVTSSQTGNTSNSATLNLINNGGPASVDLLQTGGKTFNLIQSCANPAGCSTVVRQ